MSTGTRTLGTSATGGVEPLRIPWKRQGASTPVQSLAALVLIRSSFTQTKAMIVKARPLPASLAQKGTPELVEGSFDSFSNSPQGQRSAYGSRNRLGSTRQSGMGQAFPQAAAESRALKYTTVFTSG